MTTVDWKTGMAAAYERGIARYLRTVEARALTSRARVLERASDLASET